MKYHNVAHPAISLWELNAAASRLKEEGLKGVDEDQLFDTVDRLRQRVDDALNATKSAKAARRSAARRPPGTRPAPAKQPVRTVAVPSAANDESIHGQKGANDQSFGDDPFAEPITPFSVSLKR